VLKASRSWRDEESFSETSFARAQPPSTGWSPLLSWGRGGRIWGYGDATCGRTRPCTDARPLCWVIGAGHRWRLPNDRYQSTIARRFSNGAPSPGKSPRQDPNKTERALAQLLPDCCVGHGTALTRTKQRWRCLWPNLLKQEVMFSSKPRFRLARPLSSQSCAPRSCIAADRVRLIMKRRTARL